MEKGRIHEMFLIVKEKLKTKRQKTTKNDTQKNNNNKQTNNKKAIKIGN